MSALWPAYRALAQDESTRTYAESLLRDAPPNALVLANWHWITPLWYLREVEGQRPDVVHDFLPKVIFSAIRDVDFLFDGSHQSLIRLFIATGVAVTDTLVLRVGSHALDIVGRQTLDGVLIGADRPLHFSLENVFILFPHDR